MSNELDDVPTDPFADDVGGEVGDPGVTAGNPVDRLFDGSAPGPSIEQLQGDYNLDWHWATALRGCCRTATGDGVPPIFEIGFGGTLGMLKELRGSGGELDGEPETQDRPWSK